MKKPVIQSHHFITEKDCEKLKTITGKIFKGEHRIATLIQAYCRGKVSKGFLDYLKLFVYLNRYRQVNLEENNGDKANS